jgi:hypothetical protein
MTRLITKSLQFYLDADLLDTLTLPGFGFSYPHLHLVGQLPVLSRFLYGVGYGRRNIYGIYAVG